MQATTKRYVVGAAIKIVASVLCAGIFYGIWLAVFLLATEASNDVIQAFCRVAAPVVTAAGFALGVVIVERLVGVSKAGFLQVLVWPLAGCVFGALAVYWYGPMLIVFGMFGLGTASVVLREILLHAQNRHH